MTALLTDGQKAKALAATKHDLMQDEHYCQALADCPWDLKDEMVFDSGFNAGANFSRDFYEARLAEDAKVRAGLVEALEAANHWGLSRAWTPKDVAAKVDAALSAAKERG